MSYSVRLLLQSGPDPENRCHIDFESVEDCMEGVCKIFEEHFKGQYPNQQSITYNVAELLEFIDDFTHISCLVKREGHASLNNPIHYTKQWIKEKVYIMLLRQAISSSGQ